MSGGYYISASVSIEGVFVDGPVAGLNYESLTCSETTAADGSFGYNACETVTFRLCDIVQASDVRDAGQDSGTLNLSGWWTQITLAVTRNYYAVDFVADSANSTCQTLVDYIEGMVLSSAARFITGANMTGCWNQMGYT